MIPLALEDLVVRYGDRTAVDHVSLEVPAGRVVALLGANGAGKTTTLEAALGLRRPAEGRVRLVGGSPQDPAARARVGAMLQSGGLPPAARPLAWISHLAQLYRSPRDPSALLEQVGIDPRVRTAHRRLSGGEQQRVKLAAALVPESGLLILDEPTAGVDLQGRDGLLDLIRERARQGTGILLTTHLLADIQDLADSIAVLRAGRVIARGTLAELTGADAGLTFRVSGPLDDALLIAGLPAGSSMESLPDGRFILRGHVTPELLAALTAGCAAQGLLATEIVPGHTRLVELLDAPAEAP